MLGGIRTLSDNLSHFDIYVQPVAARMVQNGIHFAFFQKIKAGDYVTEMKVDKRICVIFNPSFECWE